ncbi:GAF and ANTAR domain-containing protein [Actinomycetospora straminea]|uniref:GAF and ANTAR domain-containing protein n=1 Tax=Actinomycetospora straminea TaxID=663607 RepID=A0ABP9EMU4_9PSEU|nr:GAF and ANTAR domain-containing protein [Actinomycetospora straminea]MDD7933418.1 GAF and ANTAR domain-containing protein [Actinomycetospora straminea]
MYDPDHETLVKALRQAAEQLTENRSIRDLETTVSKLVHAAVTTIPGASGGGISRTELGTVRSSHATDERIYELDQLQSDLGQGPCITAADDPPETGVVTATDLAGDDAARWPEFAPRCVRAGHRSLMSVQLSLHGERRSALNIYSHDPGVFDTSAQLTAGLFGLQAAVLLHGADHAAHLGHALESRDTIGQAKGILMERFTVDDDEAFQMLVSSSQETNIRLVDVARWLTEEAAARRAENQRRAPHDRR